MVVLSFCLNIRFCFVLSEYVSFLCKSCFILLFYIKIALFSSICIIILISFFASNMQEWSFELFVIFWWSSCFLSIFFAISASFGVALDVKYIKGVPFLLFLQVLGNLTYKVEWLFYEGLQWFVLFMERFFFYLKVIRFFMWKFGKKLSFEKIYDFTAF